jgi:polyisoprenoid-binding protein YceI
MVSRILSVVGAMAVLGALAATALGLWVLEDRITVVVTATAPAGEPAADALLREEVVSLRAQIETLQTALASHLETLGTALDERAVARHEATVGPLHTLVDAAAEQAKLLQRSDAGLAALARQVAEQEVLLTKAMVRTDASQPVPPDQAADPTPAPSAAVPTAVASPPAEGAPREGTTAAADAAPQPAVPLPPVAAAPAAAAPGGRFLSFRMPKASSPFSGPHEFVLLEDLCRVGFDAKSTLHDFTGVTTKVDGAFRAQLDDPQQPWSGRVRCAASALDTGLAGRDENLREHLAVTNFPTIEFTIARAEAGSVDVAAQRWQGVVHGTMTIRGKSRDVAMPVEITSDASQRLVLTGQTALRLSDYEVAVPSQLGGAIRMQDEVKVWIALRARAKAGGGR